MSWKQLNSWSWYTTLLWVLFEWRNMLPCFPVQRCKRESPSFVDYQQYHHWLLTVFFFFKATSNSCKFFFFFFFASVQFSHSFVSDSLQLHEPQHVRPPCLSPTSGVHSNPCPSSRWCHPAISSSVIPFSSCPSSFPASGSFQMSQLFTSGGQSIGVSASTSVLPMNTQDWSPSEWTGWISVQSKGLSRVFSNTTVQKHQFFSTQPSL